MIDYYINRYERKVVDNYGTRSIWMGLADHFFSNCIVTNLLHVVTSTGVDEMQIARVLIGELTSFVAILIYMKFKKIKIEAFEKVI